MTTVLNSYIAPVVSRHLERLDAGLRASGFDGPLFVMQTGGGVQRAAQIAQRAVHTLASGPVGGLSAAVAVGQQLGHRNIISTDVGGTSFDVGLVVDGRVQYIARPMFERYALATPVVDIVSIGTGGGSVAWVDQDLGVLRVGPMSAGADPGPACYGRGGTAPTVTDAAAVLGYVDRLGGRLSLDVAAARRAIEQRVATPLGLDVIVAAEGILRVAAAQMADLVRRVTVQRGHDPKDFALYAYGGAAPQYAGLYASDLGVGEVVIPNLASVFSAYGAIATELRTAAEQEVRPCDLDESLEMLAGVVGKLEKRVAAELSGADFASGLVVERRLGLRFRRQVHELRILVPDGDLDEAAAAAVRATFVAEYERIVGTGTSYAEAGVEVVNVSVDARLRLPSHEAAFRHGGGAAGPEGTRRAWFGGEEHDCPVLDAGALVEGRRVVGPAFVVLPTTTVVVYPSQTATVDAHGNLSISSGGVST